jgi:hypothetical protein
MTGKTRAEQLREKTERLQARQTAGHQETAAAPHVPHSTAAEPVLSKPVRSTLDLPPATHRDLQAWLGEAAVRLGRARVTKQDVLEAMVRRLLVDETLAKLILADLKERQ